MFDSRGETRLALCLLVISALLNGLHCMMSSNVLFTEKFLDTIVPVFHNVQAGMVIPLAGLVKDRGYCSLSLRHPEALSSLQALSDHVRTKYPDSMCRIGASTVANIDQVLLIELLLSH